jgi:hypothetical protein
MNRFIYFILGFSLIVFGIGIFFDPSFYDSRHGVKIDLTGYNIPVGLLTVLLGVLLI